MADAWGGSWGNPSAWGVSWGASIGETHGGPGKGKGKGHRDEPALIAPFIRWGRKKKAVGEVLEVSPEPTVVAPPIINDEGKAVVSSEDYPLYLETFIAHQAEIRRISSVEDQMKRLIQIIEKEMADQDDDDVLTLLLN